MMTVDKEELKAVLKEYIDANYSSSARGMSVYVHSNDFEFLHFTGSIPELNFTYSKDTLYDMASLTKPMVTATLIMKYVEDGIITLEDSLETVGLYKPELAISKLTIRQLLTHTSGLIPDSPLYEQGYEKEDYIKTIGSLFESRTPTPKEEYSDLNYILLGFVIESIADKSLDRVASEKIFQPLSMKSSTFNPEVDRGLIAPTENDPKRGGLVWGKVHDEKSYYLGGVAGHAGLFSTIGDVTKYVSSLISGKVLRNRTLQTMISPQNISLGGMFGLSWMIKLPRPYSPSPSFGYNAFMGDLALDGTFGHTGFTGTSICIEPKSSTYVIILSNRVYPTRNNLGILRFRRSFHNLVFSNLLA